MTSQMPHNVGSLDSGASDGVPQLLMAYVQECPGADGEAEPVVVTQVGTALRLQLQTGMVVTFDDGEFSAAYVPQAPAVRQAA